MSRRGDANSFKKTESKNIMIVLLNWLKCYIFVVVNCMMKKPFPLTLPGLQQTRNSPER